MRGIDAKENWDARTKHERERERERLSKNESNMSGFLQLLDFIVYILI